MKTLLHLAHEHLEFRIPEVKSIARVFGIDLKIPPSYHSQSPFLVVDLPSREDAIKITQRSVLIKSAVQLLVEADNYDTFFQRLSTINPSSTVSKSFRVRVDTFNKTLSQQDKLNKIELLTSKSIAFEGKVVLGDSCETTYHLLEHYHWNQSHPQHIYFGKWICDGQREWINKYDLKKRKFIGNTSMDVTLSMIMANMAMARPGSLVYDPFVGTGSLLVACGHYGSHVMGSDIDFNLVTGVGKSSRCGQKWRHRDESIRNNLQQYNLQHLYLDVFIADAALLHKMWRHSGECGGGVLSAGDSERGRVVSGCVNSGLVSDGGEDFGGIGDAESGCSTKAPKVLGVSSDGNIDGGEAVRAQATEDNPVDSHHNNHHHTHHPRQPIFDAIITDPPYGIREPTLKLGFKTQPADGYRIDEELRDNHIPGKRAYQMGHLFSDLLTFAALHLCVGGRLVYWMPVYKQDYTDANIPQHKCMQLISNCLQSLNSNVGRRLVTMQKISHFTDEKVTTQSDHYADASFRQKYFRSPSTQPTAVDAIAALTVTDVTVTGVSITDVTFTGVAADDVVAATNSDTAYVNVAEDTIITTSTITHNQNDFTSKKNTIPLKLQTTLTPQVTLQTTLISTTTNNVKL